MTTDVSTDSATDDHLDFTMTHRQLQGARDIGYRVHCNRDHAMVVGFNGELELSRSRTIMEGAACCDFRFRKKARWPLTS